jgi:hypothetical protein
MRWVLIAGLLGSSAGCSLLGTRLAAQEAARNQRAAEAAAAAAKKKVPTAENLQAVELATADGSTTYCQGGKPPKLRLVVTVEGSTHEGIQEGKGQELFKLLQWSASVGKISNEGEWEFLADSPKAALHEVVITAAAAKPGLSAQLKLAPDFKCERTADFRGEPGKEGERGMTGNSGSAGTSAQQAGGHGSDGGPGGPGGPGGDALPVEVAVGSMSHPQQGQLVLVRMQQVGGKKKAYYLLDPTGAPLTVDVSGGAGGKGGYGGQGGMGAIGHGEYTSGQCCNGSGGNGGNGAAGGTGGIGGRGAAVTVKLDSKQAVLKERIRVVNGPGPAGEGGAGGSGGDGAQGGRGSQGAYGSDGSRGSSGPTGAAGQPGLAGPAPKFVNQRASQLFPGEAL